MAERARATQQMHEKCSILKQQMEEASRMIQHFRDSYNILHTQYEEVKKVIQYCEVHPAFVWPVVAFEPTVGSECDLCPHVMQRMTSRTHWTRCRECQTLRCTACSKRETFCCILEVVRMREAADGEVEAPEQQQQQQQVEAPERQQQQQQHEAPDQQQQQQQVEAPDQQQQQPDAEKALQYCEARSVFPCPVVAFEPAVGSECDLCTHIIRRITSRTHWTRCRECQMLRCTPCSRRDTFCCILEVVRMKEAADAVVEASEQLKSNGYVKKEAAEQQVVYADVHQAPVDEDAAAAALPSTPRREEQDAAGDMLQHAAAERMIQQEDAMEIDVGEEFFYAPTSSSDPADLGKQVIVKLEKSSEEETVDVVY